MSDYIREDTSAHICVVFEGIEEIWPQALNPNYPTTDQDIDK